MSIEEHVSTAAISDAMRQVRVRTEDMLKGMGPRVPADVQRTIAHGIEAILDDVFAQLTRASRRQEFMPMEEVAEMLFVSGPHVVKLIDQGKLKLHHMTGKNRFVRRDLCSRTRPTGKLQ